MKEGIVYALLKKYMWRSKEGKNYTIIIIIGIIIGSITFLELTKTDYDYEKDVYTVLDKITNSEIIINNFEPERHYLKIINIPETNFPVLKESYTTPKIIKNKITTTKKIPYNQVVDEICPGQTSWSVAKFASNLARETKDGKTVLSKAPIYDICAKRLEEPPLKSYLGNEEKANDKLNYANEILEIRNSILRGD